MGRGEGDIHSEGGNRKKGIQSPKLLLNRMKSWDFILHRAQ